MARSEVCKNCCPHGGAIFHQDFGCFQHVSTKEWMEEPEWVKVCTNCGHYKTPRKRKPRLTFDEMLALPNDSTITRMKDRAIYHYLSDNGYWRQYKNICEKYRQEAEKRGITKIAILMIPHYNDYNPDKLYKLSNKTQPRKWDIDFNIGQIKKMRDDAQAKLDEDYGNED